MARALSRTCRGSGRVDRPRRARRSPRRSRARRRSRSGCCRRCAPSRVDLANALRAAAVGSRTRSGGRGRDVLIVTQMALGLVLVVGAGLVVQSFRALAAGASRASIRGHADRCACRRRPGRSSPNRAAAQAYHDDVRAAPRRAAWRGRGRRDQSAAADRAGAAAALRLRRRDRAELGAAVCRQLLVTPGYFAAVRATLLAGRDLTADEIASGRRVIVIDDSLADRALRRRRRRRSANAAARAGRHGPRASSKSSAWSRTCAITTCAARSCRRSIAAGCSEPTASPSGPTRNAAALADAARAALASSSAPARPCRTCGCSPPLSMMRSGRCAWPFG